MKRVAQTSIIAWDHAQPEIALRQKMVYDALIAGAKNDRMISLATGLPINVVTPRRGELVAAGLVVPDIQAPCPLSGRLTTYWRTANSVAMEKQTHEVSSWNKNTSKNAKTSRKRTTSSEQGIGALRNTTNTEAISSFVAFGWLPFCRTDSSSPDANSVPSSEQRYG